jgi:hypothetical protein
MRRAEEGEVGEVVELGWYILHDGYFVIQTWYRSTGKFAYECSSFSIKA